MSVRYARSPRSIEAHKLVQDLQQRFVARLEALSSACGDAMSFAPVDWLRDEGQHGGGRRYVAADTAVFNRASMNVSQVQYEDRPEKKLASATALSCIIHPANPHGPSMHMHISWTEMKTEQGYWRVMADLNPALPESADRERFRRALADASGDVFSRAEAQGDRYFLIPALERTRGVAHFYLEAFSTGHFDNDQSLAQQVGTRTIDAYAEVLSSALRAHPTASDDDRRRQLDYHTVYLFQVLTLDRGTTSGLLVHDQNDVGILGSLPSHVDRALLSTWVEKVPKPQDELLRGLIEVLRAEQPSPVDEATKRALARVVRAHYGRHPGALSLQAAGDIIPPTVSNHATVEPR